MPFRPKSVRLAVLPALGLALLLALAALAPGSARAQAPATDIGIKDQNYGTIGGSITGSKPESKLWFNDGVWWADMYSTATSTHRVFRLNRTTGVWSDAGTQLDNRATTRSDILWDAASNKLYVASHSYTSQSATATSGTDGRLYRYSYNSVAKTYSLDTGFPVNVGSAKTETLVIDRDSTGVMWATWAAGNKVYVNHTNGTDTTWGTPYVLPGSGTLDPDDITSLIAFKGKIGVMWSAQNKSTTPESGNMYFAVHGDGTGDAAANWSVSAIPTGWSPDDHINLKVDPNGNIFAAVKTSESSGPNPLILLLKRTLTNAATGAGTWSSAVFGRVTDSHTRPIVLLDPTDNMLHMFATCPQPPNKSGQSGGNICEKTASMSSPSFATGIGTAVIQDHTSTDMNDVTSTKQNVSPATGLVVMSNDKTTHLYWHADESLGGGGGPTAPTADFTATPTSGTAPLVVQFTSTSTGSPTSYSWDFGDGTPAGTGANPTHTYSSAGTYTVSLTASNGTGSDTKTQTNLISVGTAPNPGGDTTFAATADALVKSTSPNNNYGSDASLRVRQGTSATDTTYHSYLKFDVSGLTGSVTGAKLRLYVTDASPDGGRVFPVASTWTESGITYGNAPAIPPGSVGSAGITTVGGYVDIDLGTAVTGNGTYSFALTNTSSNSAYYSSREGAHAPQLVVSTSGGGGDPGPGALAADFSGSPTAGSGTLNTTFTDLTTGGPDGWTWDFGDGSAVSHLQNPTHNYTSPGTYTVTLTAARSADGASSVKTRTGYIVVSPSEPPPSGGTLTFNPIADAHVKNTSSTTNYGTATTLQVRQGDASNNTTYISYLKFAVTGVNGAPVSSAKLRLYVTDASPDGGSVFRVDDTWTETGLTYATRPLLPPTSIGNAGSVAAGGYVDIDLGSAVSGDGTYSFAVQSSSTNSAIYASRESVNKPQLVLGV